MRAKVAKALRRRARELSRGMPERQLLAHKSPRKIKVTNPDHPKFGETVDVTVQSAVNNPASTRGIYRRLKKGLPV